MAKKWYELPAICLLFLAVGLVSTYPLMLDFYTGIPFDSYGGNTVYNRSGDQLQLMYWFWLVKENVLGNVPFDTNPFEFNPFVTTGLNTIPLAFIYFIFSPLGDVAAYNSTIISSYVLTGLFMYLLVKLYTGSRSGALLAALIFTLVPYRIRGLAAGHGYALLFFCYPFILYYLERGIRSARIRYGILSSMGLIFLAMVEPHLIYYIIVFLGIFIPFRVFSLLPIGQGIASGLHHLSPKLSPLCSILLVWGAGAAAVIYAQALFFGRTDIFFFSESFWWSVLIYPLLLLLLSFCFVAIYQRLANLDFEESMTIEAKSTLPLFLCLPLALAAFFRYSIDTGFLVAAGLVVVIATKIWLLRSYLPSMLKIFAVETRKRKKMIFPTFPLIFSMGAIVYWIYSSKVGEIAPTIAGGGRTIEDVSKFSAHLTDLSLPLSNVYIGVVPALIGAGVLLKILISSSSNIQRFQFVDQVSLLRLFYMLIALSCLILSLGMALGQISLYALFFHYFPFFNYPRVSDRIITLSLFALAIVVGFVVKGFQLRWQDGIGRAAVSLLIFSAIGFQLIDYSIFMPMGINILDRGQDIYTYVKENIDAEELLLEIPFWPGDSHQSSLYQHYIMLDRIPRLNGSSPLVLKEYIETVYEPLASINQGKLDKKQFELLHGLGVKYITVHNNKDVFPAKVSRFLPLNTIRRLQNSPFLEWVPIENTMYFKDWKKNNDRLFLFQVKPKDQVRYADEQAWYDMPYFYDVNWRLHRQIGRIVKDTDIDKYVFVAAEKQEKEGFLVYGPYDTYSPGDYRCYFSINIQGDSGTKVARIEVARLAENKMDVLILAQQDLRASNENGVYTIEHLDFSIEKNTLLEFRVFYYGTGEVRVEKIAVNSTASREGLHFIDAEKMVGDIGQLESVEEAITGKVIEADEEKNEEGDMVYGPNRIYAKGVYRARFLLRLKNGQKLEGDTVVAVISLTDGQNTKTLSRHEVRAAELNKKSFSGIGMDFELERDEFISFHVLSREKAHLQLDGIEVISQ